MKIFIDTADLDEIKTAYSWGIIDGITTNPSLIAKAAEKLIGLACKKGGKCGEEEGTEKTSRKELTLSELEDYIAKILEEAKPDPVSLEVTATGFDEMLCQAKKIYSRFKEKGYINIVIKIPVNPSLDTKKPSFEGLIAIKRLAKEGIRTNATLIMTPEQALLAAKAGATYVSPFAGRIDDYLRDNIAKQKVAAKSEYKKEDYYPAEGKKIDEIKITNDNGIISGVDLVIKTVEIFRNYNISSEIIAASIRNARQARELAATGVDIATIPFYVLEEMINHYKTAEGMAKFMADAGKVPAYEQLLK